MAVNFPEKETGSTPKASSTNRVLIIAGIVVVCLVGLCCLVIVAGFLLFQIRTRETIVPLPQTLPQIITVTAAPALPFQPSAAVPAASLDYGAEALSGSTNLQRAFSPDPFSVIVMAGGKIDTSTVGLDCGFTTQAPSFTFRYGGGASETFLRIFFTASDGTDSTLVVYTPDREWKCADNSSYGGLVDPVMDFEFGPSGKYVLWAGTKLSDTYAKGKIYITASQSIAP
jgi:hypothetical protein